MFYPFTWFKGDEVKSLGFTPIVLSSSSPSEIENRFFLKITPNDFKSFSVLVLKLLQPHQKLTKAAFEAVNGIYFDNKSKRWAPKESFLTIGFIFRRLSRNFHANFWFTSLWGIYQEQIALESPAV